MAPAVKSGKELDRLSLWALADAFQKHSSGWPKKIAAEAAFALAIGIKNAADKMGFGFKDKKEEYAVKAQEFADACLAILAKLPANTLDDVAPYYTTLAGVTIPNYIYRDYVEIILAAQGLAA